MFVGDALPGIRVDIAPAPVAEALPRMDVAVFAGFAERGPCHRAIALSSAAAYERCSAAIARSPMTVRVARD